MGRSRLSIVVDLNSPLPAYRQIIDSLRVHLVEGALRPGDRVPPVRELASDLGLHFNTAAEAYRQLAAEGWLRLDRGRRGARVAQREAAQAGLADEIRWGRRVRALIAEARAAGIEVSAILEELGALRAELEMVSQE